MKSLVTMPENNVKHNLIVTHFIYIIINVPFMSASAKQMIMKSRIDII